DALAFDLATPTRLWLVAGGRAYRSDDRAAAWQPVGTPIPDAQAITRGISAGSDAMLVATDRGVFRSTDAGASWALLKAELPDNGEAALMVHDPQTPGTVYAAFSRMG